MCALFSVSRVCMGGRVRKRALEARLEAHPRYGIVRHPGVCFS